MRQVTSSVCTGFAAKLRELDKAGIAYIATISPNAHTIIMVAVNDFVQANDLCMSVASRGRKLNRGWRH